MRFCNYCNNTLWPDAPEEIVVKSNEPYCNRSCYERHRYEKRRPTNWHWTHDCGECGRPMFAPVRIDGWFCPECNRTEEIDTSYWEWWRNENYGWDGDFERECPECDSRIWLFDGALTCYNDDCDMYVTQFGGEWWALIESEYPSKERELTEQTQL